MNIRKLFGIKTDEERLDEILAMFHCQWCGGKRHDTYKEGYECCKKAYDNLDTSKTDAFFKGLMGKEIIHTKGKRERLPMKCMIGIWGGIVYEKT